MALATGQKVSLRYKGETVTGKVTGGPFQRDNKLLYRVEHRHGAGKVERLVVRTQLREIKE